jgi:hypothetical protein
MATTLERSGTLQPGQWTKVMWGWGVYSLTYQAFGTGLPVDVEKYTPIKSSFQLGYGGFFEFSPIGYGDVWFRSGTGGDYQIVPA